VRHEVTLVAIERPDGLLVERLLDAGLRILPLHPNQVAATRDPEVLMADLAALPVGTTKEIRRVHHAVLPLRLDCGYVSRTTTLRHANNINHTSDDWQSSLWLHPTSIKEAQPPQTLGIGPQALKNFRLGCGSSVPISSYASGCACCAVSVGWVGGRVRGSRARCRLAAGWPGQVAAPRGDGCRGGPVPAAGGVAKSAGRGCCSGLV
jgi:hypothetical protein